MMIAILNKAKGRVGVNAQSVIMVFLGLIVAKLYPDWWKGALATVAIYLLLSVVKRSVCQVLTGFLWTLKTIFMVSHYSSWQALSSSALASGSIGNLIRDQLCGWFAEQA
ncbi:hypothetical protein KXB77_001400 [Escherichia coli]|nr:hypothetical protein [Escherichia coli]EKO3322721.1 hypothetical protein [Escherichia coli]